MTTQTTAITATATEKPAITGAHMTEIFIVNHVISGYTPECYTYYHHTEAEAQGSYDECMESVSMDPVLVELIRLDLATLEATVIHSFEGTMDDLGEGYGEEDGDEDDWIVEGKPDGE